jgi:DNA-binding MarR family transcriptional regulator
MSRRSEKLMVDLVEAFTELGPAWSHWVGSCVPNDAVSYVRLRLLTALKHGNGQAMASLAQALNVTPRRITDLVDALEGDGLVERNPNPRDGRSTLISITPEGIRHQEIDWLQLQADVGGAFGELTLNQQQELLEISRELTTIFHRRLDERQAAEV